MTNKLADVKLMQGSIDDIINFLEEIRNTPNALQEFSIGSELNNDSEQFCLYGKRLESK